MSVNTSRQKTGHLQMEALESRLVPTCVPGTISGFVYEDTNDNGVREPGEPGIEGVPIQLRTMDAAETVIGNTTTDANGYYEFTGLTAGSFYVIEEMAQPDCCADGLDAVHNEPVPFSDTTDELCVGLPVDGLCENNFGEGCDDEPHEPPTDPLAKLGGSVYFDADDDGVFDHDEPPIAGVMVTLTGTATADGSPVSATTTTAADGSYRFYGLPAGTYEVCETQPAGYADGKDTVGFIVNGTASENVAGTVTGNDCLGGITLSPGACGFEYNFGERPTPPTEVTGREGLTPGFWKNNAVQKNGSAWGATGHFMYQTLGSVFDLAGTPYANLANKTLVQALSLNGGGANALLRHAVAALLNASHPSVDYPLTTTQIITAVNAALASGSTAQIDGLKDLLDGYNNLGADLDQHGRTK